MNCVESRMGGGGDAINHPSSVRVAIFSSRLLGLIFLSGFLTNFKLFFFIRAFLKFLIRFS